MEKKNKPIGIFDSGVGGLTVVNHLLEVLDKENFIFFADNANVPYGNKDKKTLKKLVNDDIDFISQFDVKAIIIACNTADSIIDQKTKDKFTVDIIGPIKATAKMAVKQTKNKKIGIMATSATCKNRAYIKAIKQLDETIEVYQQPCSLLASYIENKQCFNNEFLMHDLLNQYLNPLLKKDVDTIILGCTHYPLALNYLKDLTQNINFISSSLATVLETKRILEEKELLADKTHIREFYTSGDLDEFKEKINNFIIKDIPKTIKKIK